MLNRRNMMATLAGMAIAPSGFAASLPRRTTDVWDDAAEVPSAKMVRGRPNRLVFDDGPNIPMNEEAFLTLWEGPTFWLTYGFGRARTAGQADNQAVRCAEGTMQLLLLTRAFAPDRLEHKDGGWRLKDRNGRRYVRGFIALPGKPFAPRTDARLGFGNLDTAAPPYLLAPTTSIGPGGGSMTPILPVDPIGENRINAFTAYIVRKKDIDLAYVHKFAQIVPVEVKDAD